MSRRHFVHHLFNRERQRRSKNARPPLAPVKTAGSVKSGYGQGCEAITLQPNPFWLERLTWRQCDAHRPKCGACASGRRSCKYATAPDETRVAALKRTHIELNHFQELRSSHHDLQQFVETLKFLDDNAAAAILRQLRQGDSIAELVRDVGTGALLLQLRDRPTLIRQGKEAESRDPTVATPPEQAHTYPVALTQRRLKAVVSPYEELFDLLRTARNEEASEILRRIRQGHDIHITLRSAKEAHPVA